MQMGKWVSRLGLWSPGIKPAVAPAASWVCRSASCLVWYKRTEALVRLARMRSRRQTAWIRVFSDIVSSVWLSRCQV